MSLLENAARYSVEKEAKPVIEAKKRGIIPNKLFFALQKSCQRRNSKLLALPKHFSRHQENTTRLENDTILWKITWILPHYSAQKIQHSERVSERIQLGNLVENFLKKLKIQDEISIYHSSRLKDLCVLLKCEFYKEKSQRFVELDTEKSLVWNLQEKVIIENPILTIVHKNHLHYFFEGKKNTLIWV